MLTIDEREYLFRIAGENPLPSLRPNREVPPAIRVLLDTLTETPAYVMDAKYDVLAWNRLATFFTGDLSAVPESRRNLIRWMFLPENDTHGRWGDPDTVSFARASVADLRAAYAQYPGDPDIGRLVAELLDASPRFAEIWAAHEVEVRRRIVKRVDHPIAGPVAFDCQVLHIPDTDQRLIIYCAEPGSATQETFRRLARTPLSEAPSPHTAADDCHPRVPAAAETPQRPDTAGTGSGPLESRG
ncbi:MmyB family transcriptional regulator [Allosalinactinospora lopnorensis]|uniref:MmyB family transcriptional regulator n=1 Tax=Allosalinactinospora lopnorensis TaxID=1352348 RepID=UPI000696BC38|nr:hypothetical protein [Allosalinactinospora lopnorensis]